MKGYVPRSEVPPSLSKRTSNELVGRRNVDLVELEPLSEVLDDPLRLKEQWDVINGGHVVYSKDLLRRDMTEHRDFFFCCRVQRLGYEETASDL